MTYAIVWLLYHWYSLPHQKLFIGLCSYAKTHSIVILSHTPQPCLKRT